jgi:hypothetical protein
VGPQRPLAVSQVWSALHDVLVQRALQAIPGPVHATAGTGKQTWSAVQPPSPEHSCGPGSAAPHPPE